MMEWGWRTNAYDPCIFINDEDGLILDLYVDNMITFRSDLRKILTFKDQMSKAFDITNEGEYSWYLGIHVK